mmetsp:Transcript_40270/g.92035  ORF Transcript_40270/g.92035 Transcript_40270/m.92035 type:complete len:284 (-) Transcript_40270:54-905(-)
MLPPELLFHPLQLLCYQLWPLLPLLLLDPLFNIPRDALVHPLHFLGHLISPCRRVPRRFVQAHNLKVIPEKLIFRTLLHHERFGQLPAQTLQLRLPGGDLLGQLSHTLLLGWAAGANTGFGRLVPASGRLDRLRPRRQVTRWPRWRSWSNCRHTLRLIEHPVLCFYLRLFLSDLILQGRHLRLGMVLPQLREVLSALDLFGVHQRHFRWLAGDCHLRIDHFQGLLEKLSLGCRPRAGLGGPVALGRLRRLGSRGAPRGCRGLVVILVEELPDRRPLLELPLQC